MSSFRFMVLTACAVWVAAVPYARAQEAKTTVPATYVGSKKCQACHGGEYARFEKYSRMTRSYSDVLIMKRGLTREEYQKCLECHTTGFGKPGGFRSAKETPRMKEVGCEACHGPGSIHVQSSDPKDIKKVVSETDCQACHAGDRIKAFRFRPMLYGGAH
ncbi:MAG: cytochrome c family protein [Syntrophobacteraceae bacterium]|nr:cytochrome c family protein [Syntrophobacteraceae bacterium]